MPPTRSSARNRATTLDDWYLRVNQIYCDRNFYRTPESLYCHLVDVGAALAGSIGGKSKAEVDARSFLVKTMSWWMTLCGRVGIRSVQDLVWTKFPRHCPYCAKPQCVGESCKPVRKKLSDPVRVPDWKQLMEIGAGGPPVNIQTPSQWQGMFASIYPNNNLAESATLALRFTEEIGEMAEALRLRDITVAFFVNEAIDVFAWLMAVANRIERLTSLPPAWLDTAMLTTFGNGCPECGRTLCKCEPILATRVARMTQDIPPTEFAHLRGYIMHTDDYLQAFGQEMEIGPLFERAEDEGGFSQLKGDL